MKIYDFSNVTPVINNTSGDKIKVTDYKSSGQYTQIFVIANRFGGSAGQTLRPTREITTSIGTTTPTVSATVNTGLSVSTQIQASISLPLPNAIAEQFRNDWSEDHVGTLETAAAFLGSNIDILGQSNRATNSGDVVGSLYNNLAQKIADTSFRKAMRDKGLAYNPYKELFYNGVAFRQFNWEWEFAPVNAAQSRRLADMIYQIKLAAHPDLLTNSIQSPYIMPDSFEVNFRGTNMDRMRDLVLTDIQYNPSNSGAGQRWHADGYPAFISLGLSFIETFPLTKRALTELHSLQGGN